MKITKKYRGEYVVDFNDGRRFAVCRDGGTDCPWNVYGWNFDYNICDCTNVIGCYETKRDALFNLSLL